MDKIKIIEVEQIDGSMVQFVILDRGDGSFTSMTKAHYDELEVQREQSGTL